MTKSTRLTAWRRDISTTPKQKTRQGAAARGIPISLHQFSVKQVYGRQELISQSARNGTFSCRQRQKQCRFMAKQHQFCHKTKPQRRQTARQNTTFQPVKGHVLPSVLPHIAKQTVTYGRFTGYLHDCHNVRAAMAFAPTPATARQKCGVLKTRRAA